MVNLNHRKDLDFCKGIKISFSYVGKIKVDWLASLAARWNLEHGQVFYINIFSLFTAKF